MADDLFARAFRFRVTLSNSPPKSPSPTTQGITAAGGTLAASGHSFSRSESASKSIAIRCSGFGARAGGSRSSLYQHDLQMRVQREPCAQQIMFDFHGPRSTVWLGAPKYETKILTDAAKNNRRVHVSGKWRRGGQSNCSYVEVTSAEVTR